MSPAEDRVAVEVDGRRLSLSNLGKVLYPPTEESPGFTKAEVVDYYTRIAPTMLAHLRGRPATFTRWPDGVEGHKFFEKNAPSHTPEWVRKVRLPSPGSGKNRDTIDYVVIDELPTLVWAANLAALELHVPQWSVDAKGRPREPDLLVLDLDPGPPATIVECSAVALVLRERLEEQGLRTYAKTSGSKGMQVYAPLRPTSAEATSAFAKAWAEQLEREQPDLVLSRMTKSLRTGKVFVDWSQNNGAKTTVAPYSLRARPLPTVSTPVTWEEVASCRAPEDLRFVAADVLDRVARDGDLMADLAATKGRPRLPEPPSPAGSGGRRDAGRPVRR
jgi:bifunctional non-homologous end joining protein LigD